MKPLGILSLLAAGLLALAALIPGAVSSEGPYETAHNVEVLDTPGVERERPYGPYQAPTGQAGFRKYYQKRCYPACHHGGAVVTPGPIIFHP